MKYIALLRGINVGGKNRVVMGDLKRELQRAGYKEVATYINSGNIMFSAPVSSCVEIAIVVKNLVHSCSGVTCDVVVITSKAYGKVIARAPDWWGQRSDWKHNLIFVIPPLSVQEAIAAFGEPKSGLEYIEGGKGVIYNSVSIEGFGKTATGKLAGTQLYRHLTIRNYNTAQKLQQLTKTG